MPGLDIGETYTHTQNTEMMKPAATQYRVLETQKCVEWPESWGRSVGFWTRH